MFSTGESFTIGVEEAQTGTCSLGSEQLSGWSGSRWHELLVTPGTSRAADVVRARCPMQPALGRHFLLGGGHLFREVYQENDHGRIVLRRREALKEVAEGTANTTLRSWGTGHLPAPPWPPPARSPPLFSLYPVGLPSSCSNARPVSPSPFLAE